MYKHWIEVCHYHLRMPWKSESTTIIVRNCENSQIQSEYCCSILSETKFKHHNTRNTRPSLYINDVVNECWTFAAVIKISFHRQWTNGAGKEKRMIPNAYQRTECNEPVTLQITYAYFQKPLFSLSVGLIVGRDL